MDNNYNNQNYQPNMNNMPPYPNQVPQASMMGGQMMGPQGIPQMPPQQKYINNAPMYQEQPQPQQPVYQQPLVESVTPVSAPKKGNKKIIFIIIGIIVGLIVLGVVGSFVIGLFSTTSYLDKSRQAAYVDTAHQYAKGAMNRMMLLGLDKITDDSLLIFMPVGHEGNTCVQLESGGQSPFNASWKMAYVAFKYNGETKGFDYYFGGYDGSDTGIKFANVEELKEESVEKNLSGYTQSLQDLYSGSLNLKKTSVADLEDDDLMEFAHTVGAKNIVVLASSNCKK